MTCHSALEMSGRVIAFCQNVYGRKWMITVVNKMAVRLQGGFFQIEVCIAGFGCKRLSIFDKEPRMHTDEHGFARGDPCLSVFIRGCNFFVIAAAMRANFA